MSARTFLVVIAVLALVGLLGFGLIDKNEEAIAVGDRAPQPELTELASGEPASLEDYRGEWLLVNFWSSWCKPCKDESPDLEAFQAAHAGKVTVVGVNLEDASDDAKTFVADLGLTYPQLRAADSRALREDYGMVARPENFLIDPEGRVALIQRGPVNAAILRERIEPLISGAT
jgi:cytochrome c biogenesis protein CcmG, thiol:disulfide interchange protein DsbE